MDLHRLRGDLLTHLAGQVLHHRRFLITATARIDLRAHVVHQLPARLDLSGHVRDLEPQMLEVRERVPELLPLFEVLRRVLESRLRQSDRPCRSVRTSDLETGHCLLIPSSPRRESAGRTKLSNDSSQVFYPW